MFGSWVMKGIQIGTEIMSAVFTVTGFVAASAIIIKVIVMLCEGRTDE